MFVAGGYLCHGIRHVCVTALWKFLNVVRMVPAVIPLFRRISSQLSFVITSRVPMNVRDAAYRCGWQTDGQG